MFNVGQKIEITEESREWKTGTKGVIIEVDNKDMRLPYLVELADKDVGPVRDWCREKEVKADED